MRRKLALLAILENGATTTPSMVTMMVRTRTRTTKGIPKYSPSFVLMGGRNPIFLSYSDLVTSPFLPKTGTSMAFKYHLTNGIVDGAKDI